jgi:hypothetical protein
MDSLHVEKLIAQESQSKAGSRTGKPHVLSVARDVQHGLGLGAFLQSVKEIAILEQQERYNKVI